MKNKKIAMIGLKYVGLPLAVEVSKKNETAGFDINQPRIDDLRDGHDFTLEVSNEEFLGSCKIKLHLWKNRVLCWADLFSKLILLSMDQLFTRSNKRNSRPILEKLSGLAFNKNFFVGYSLE